MSTLQIAADHPALPGHFPGDPLVPAVVILDQLLCQLAKQQPQLRVSGVRKLKFLRPLRGGETFEVQWSESRAGGIRFVCRVGEALLAEGHLMLAGPEESAVS